MKITITKPKLSKLLQIAQSGVASRATLPILSHLLMESENNRLRISATDLEISVKCESQVETKVAGSIALPAKIFMDIVKELPDGKSIELTAEKEIMEIKCGGARFSITGASKTDFPTLHEVEKWESFTLKTPHLKSMLEKTVYAMSTEEARYTLNSVYFNTKQDTLRMVATDGRRLSYVDCKIDKEKKIKGIVPSKAVNELLKILEISQEDNVEAIFSQTQVSFVLKDVVLTSRLVEGAYPNYEQVIPKEFESEAVIKRDDLLQATKQASLCTPSKTGSVNYSFRQNKLKIFASTQGLTTAEIEIPVEFTGTSLEISFNPNYILEFLRTVTSEKVLMRLTGALSPALLKPLGDENYFYIVMPMKSA